MAKRPLTIDPHAAREARKYENPIPSREFIIELLTKAGEPMSRGQLGAALALDDLDEIEGLRRRLKAMERDGQLLRGRKGDYGLIKKMDLIKGRVIAHRDGFGFLAPEAGGDDLYLSSRQMDMVFDGDEIICRVSGENFRGKPEVKIVEVIKHNTLQLVGRFFNDKGVAYVVPDNARLNHDVHIPIDLIGDAKPEQYVMVEITQQPGRRTKPVGRITELLGEHMGPGMEIDVAIRSHDIPYIWPDEVLAQAQMLAAEPTEEDKRARVDLRELPFVTIDGEDARDFDDAVFCQSKAGGGWRLWVAIADVSHYVAIESALDCEAKVRGNSVYFPEQVVPMLPEALSNGLCSLKPQVDRLCLVCEMTISANGRLSGYTFFEAVMHSHARLTYNKVGAMLDATHKEHKSLRKQYSELLPDIEQLHLLYKTLRKARTERGAIDFETKETRMIFGENRKIEQIVPVVRNDAHKIIEECMLSANVAAARYLEKNKIPALYRVHEGPKDAKLLALRKYLGELGLELMGGDKPGPKEYQILLQRIEARPDAHIVQTMMLRSLRQAVYQPENLGHFGLNYVGYTHFTSPIRRYPDLLVHRAIRHCVRQKDLGGTIESSITKITKGRKPKAFKYTYAMPDLLALGEQCSMTERRADDATRDVVAWLKCEYVKDRVGDVFKGVVSAVTGFGLFVDLVEVYVEGLVHVSSLDRDYYHFDAIKQRLVGERTGASFHLGDEITVRVLRVSLDDKKIDLEVVEASARAKRHGKRAVQPENKKSKKRGKNRFNKKVVESDSRDKKTLMADVKAAGKATTNKKRVEKRGAISKESTGVRKRDLKTDSKDGVVSNKKAVLSEKAKKTKGKVVAKDNTKKTLLKKDRVAVKSKAKTATTISDKAKPGAKSSVKSTAKPRVKPTAKPGVKSTAKPGVKSTAKPSVKSTAKPSVKSTAKPSVKSTAKPSVKSTAKPRAKSGEVTSVKTTKKASAKIKTKAKQAAPITSDPKTAAKTKKIKTKPTAPRSGK